MSTIETLTLGLDVLAEQLRAEGRTVASSLIGDAVCLLKNHANERDAVIRAAREAFAARNDRPDYHHGQ